MGAEDREVRTFNADVPRREFALRLTDGDCAAIVFGIAVFANPRAEPTHFRTPARVRRHAEGVPAHAKQGPGRIETREGGKSRGQAPARGGKQTEDRTGLSCSS